MTTIWQGKEKNLDYQNLVFEGENLKIIWTQSCKQCFIKLYAILLLIKYSSFLLHLDEIHPNNV